MITVKKVLLVGNHHNKNTLQCIEEMREYFEEKGIEVNEHQTSERYFNHQEEGVDLSDTDLAISLGGDGTLLYCARILAGKRIPILALNLGDFGFITEISRSEWKDSLEKYVSGRLSVSRRMMLEVCVNRNDRPERCYLGLNDGVIGSGGISKIIKLKVFISNTFISRYRADGVIVATPTGSTAYSMAAGGPILHHEMKAMVLSPICPFTLSNRPLVVPGDEVLEIVVEENQRTSVMLTVDGQEAFDLQPNDRILFRRSENETLIIQSDKRNFYEVLRRKLNWAGEPNAK